MITLVRLPSVGSTNSYIDSEIPSAPHGTVVLAHEQTAGRGQRGNTWEAAPGMNVTMSMVLRPRGLEPARQFLISQAVSLAVVEVLDTLLPDHTVSVKWPNDIYVGDRKICGILIENVLEGRSIARCTVGLGLNVNQPEFTSPAPNPVSLTQLTGLTYDVEAIALAIAERIEALCDRALSSAEEAGKLAGDYFSRLWRVEGWWPFHDHLRDIPMTARIVSVDPSGPITLEERTDLSRHTYAFKEISFTL